MPLYMKDGEVANLSSDREKMFMTREAVRNLQFMVKEERIIPEKFLKEVPLNFRSEKPKVKGLKNLKNPNAYQEDTLMDDSN